MTTKPLPEEITRVGNLTEDPELRFTPAGIAVCEARLAFEPYDQETKKRGETVFYRLTIWRELGEHAAMSLHKGDRVIVVGQPSTREWTTNTGEARTDKIITVRSIGPDLRFATVDGITKVRKQDTTEKQEEFF